jgi:hypothetical protein
MREEVSVFVNGAALHRHSVPDRGNGLVEAISDRAHGWKSLGEADRWSDLTHREIASRFQNNPMYAGPMAMGPNTIKGDPL